MVESVLRASGYRTGLFTSPHLCDVRERVRINGQMVSRGLFEEHFWRCHDALSAAATAEVGMPGYFRFITLLGLSIFLSQDLDVVVLEVGIGGRLDATNVIPHPAVCGVTSLGFDHMELLGDTLPKIAREKGGILKRGSPAWSVAQPDDAMEALRECAEQAGTTISVPPPLSAYTLDGAPPSARGDGLRLQLSGAHQLVNASLAVQLAAAWEAARGGERAEGRAAMVARGVLPAEYRAGLEAAAWPGRSQVVEDEEFAEQGGGSRLTFYLDGAHTPESMAACAEWFADASGPDGGSQQQHASAGATVSSSGSGGSSGGSGGQQHKQGPLPQSVLMFNCMKERDPAALLPALHGSLARRGVEFDAALFVPPDSQYAFLASAKSAPKVQEIIADVSWQAALRDVWERSLPQQAAARATGAGRNGPQDAARGAVAPSVSGALATLRAAVRSTPGLRLRVLVTGSLYLVGDTLRALGRAPK
ncbi:folylpolyglutamate synthase [Monoraphidium neglectum]|uniref:Folylpolyglutamate synthase n=1 Tax=Monoraphidium neglectum TaxID=145388 RepID=A0A0D2MQP6_9CHLO|nr:folylpolyglutamate synthase [Monoraphidium neglectum]KIZ04965.1 folylpolyglutamate synthase [Monoraphidium neglectum]|eukprot:XP_013903984.1 folylpolyglutamate synthase [Monoraphidium neglectum]